MIGRQYSFDQIMFKPNLKGAAEYDKTMTTTFEWGISTISIPGSNLNIDQLTTVKLDTENI